MYSDKMVGFQAKHLIGVKLMKEKSYKKANKHFSNLLSEISEY